MIQRRAALRRRAIAVIAVLLSMLLAAPLQSAQARRAQGQPVNARSVTLTVTDVTPTTPKVSATAGLLAVTLSLHNNTDQSLGNVRIDGARGNPIASRAALDDAIAHVRPPDAGLVAPIHTTQPVTANLGPGATDVVTFTTTTSTDSSSAGVCLCQDRIYPLYFTAHASDAGGTDVEVGAAQTFIPSFTAAPSAPMQVSWIWPVTERPHRLIGDSTFIDDDLAYSVDGGRLDRVLSVIEQVAQRSVALTLVVDPELIDELAVMAGGSYTVVADGKSTPGRGAVSARNWLARFRAVLAEDSKLELDFTPLADPDVESLNRNGLAWTSGLSPTVRSRVTTALGGRVAGTALAWPVGGSVSPATLDQLVRDGATSVVVSDRALPSSGGANSTANQLASLPTPAGPVTADVTSTQIQRYAEPLLRQADPAVSQRAGGASQLPMLVAEVAVAALSPDGSANGGRFVTIAAPRDVNPNPTIAARAILETAATGWSTSLTSSTAAHAVQPSDHAQLVPPQTTEGQLSDLTIDAARKVSETVPALATMMAPSDASQILGALPTGVQRAESSAWRLSPAAGDAFATALTTRIDGIVAGVRIVRPSAGTYTLTSSNSPLPITVENDLNVTVRVRVDIVSANDLPGFSAKQIGLQTIAPHTKVTLHVPTHVERAGRFRVQASLETPNEVRIGDPVLLSVHSTALGTIGVVITVVAALVLAVALLVRLFRRWRSPRRRPTALGQR